MSCVASNGEPTIRAAKGDVQAASPRVGALVVAPRWEGPMRRSSLAIAVALSATLVALSLSAASAEPAWHPNGTGLLDCNGFSPVQHVVKHLQCAEIAAN